MIRASAGECMYDEQGHSCLSLVQYFVKQSSGVDVGRDYSAPRRNKSSLSELNGDMLISLYANCFTDMMDGRTKHSRLEL